MSGRSFASVGWVATVAGAALGCYLVSLRVASERAALEDVENRIVLAQRDIRLLQTELGTRGRLAQLERWNVKVLALSAPSADQFVDSGFALARLTTPERRIDLTAPVVLASANADDAARRGEARLIQADFRPGENRPAADPQSLIHQASLKTGATKVAGPGEAAAPTAAKAGAVTDAAPEAKAGAKPAGAASASARKPSDEPAAAIAPAKPAAKIAGKVSATVSGKATARTPVTVAAKAPAKVPAKAPSKKAAKAAAGTETASRTPLKDAGSEQ